MDKTKYVFISGLILSFISCALKNEKPAIITDTLRIKPPSRIDTVSDVAETASARTKSFEVINQVLFDNLVNGEFGPFAFENDSGYYELDIESYIERLKDHEIFSEEFFSHEKRRTEDCRRDLEQRKHRGDTDVGWEPNSCFFNFMYWLRSQESPKGFEIKNLEISERVAKSNMVFFDESDGEKTYWDHHVFLEVHYRKEENEWKVAEILRLPND